MYRWMLQRDFVRLDMKGSMTRLWIAAFFGLHEIAQHLISLPEYQDNDSLLQAAVANNHRNIIHLLIKSGADVNGQGKSGSSALQIASYFGYETVVALLIANGANVQEHRGKYGTAMQAAAVQGHIGVVQILVNNGAEVNSEGGNVWNRIACIFVSWAPTGRSFPPAGKHRCEHTE
jgi:ankyrin repeat protein